MISYFDESFYLGEKLAQLKVVDPNGDLNGGKPWTTTSEVRAAFTQNGLTAEQHFEQYGQYEGLSPVAEFVAAEYLAMKAEQLNAIKQDGRTDWSADSALAAIQAAGMSAWSHYLQFGDSEGLSPSYALDEAKYCQAKAEAMNAAAGEGEKSDWTADEIKAAINDAGMTVLDHFENYAGEGPGEAARAEYPVDHKPFQYDLTTDNDTINGTAADEIINGATGTSRVATLNEGDKIDGGDGTDTLNVDMAKSFTGFKGDGFMKNVEIVNLDSSASSAVTFSGKGVEGVQTYNLSGTVNLSDLSAAGIAVNLADRAKAADIKFAADAVKGKEDALTLGLHNVGTVDADKGDTNVDVTFNGIENLTVNAAGENVVTLKGGNAVKTVAVTGDGDLKVKVGDTSLESVDASVATGDLNVDLTAATTKLASVTLGSGDDRLNLGVNSAADLSIDGGAGDDEVVLSGITVASVKELQMSNVETLTVNGNTGALTLSGARTTGLQTVKLDGAGAEVTLADFQSSELNLLFVDANTHAVNIDDVPTLDITVGDDDDVVDSMSGVVTAGGATSVSLSVADGATFSGGLVANKATSLTVDSTSSNDLAFAASTDLSSIENMELKSNGDVTFTGVAHLGGKSDSITVDASAVKGDFAAAFDAYTQGGASLNVVGSHLADNNITVNNGYDSIEVTGGIKVDTIALHISDEADIVLNTGLGTDMITTTIANTTKDIKISGDLGDNGEIMSLDASGVNNSIKIDISGLEGYDEINIAGSNFSDELIGGSGNDVITAGSVRFNKAAVDAQLGKAEYTFSGSLNGDDSSTVKIGNITSDAVATGTNITNVQEMVTFIGNDANLSAVYDASIHNGNLVLTEKTAGIGIGDSNAPSITVTTGITMDAGTLTTPGHAASVAIEAIYDTLTGNAGDDLFVLSTTTTSTDTDNTATSIITDFGNGQDTLKIGALGAGLTAYTEDPTSYKSLSDLLAAADGVLDGGTKFFAAMVNSDTYLVASDSGSGHDAIVQLQGVALDDLANDGSFIVA